MQVTATELRKDLFKLLERALHGETVEVVYKGSTVHLAATATHSKLGRAKRQHALACDPDAIVHTDRKLMTRLESEWLKEASRM